jgi:hypothetical protein
MHEIEELLERFRRGAEVIASVTTGLANVEADWLPGAGKWTVRQIACHLADSEMVGAMRLRQVLAEDNPTMIAFDENAWAERLDHRTRKVSAALEAFRGVRAGNYELLRAQPEAAFARFGTHSVNGRQTLLDLLRGYAEHAESHARQIHEVRQAYKRSRP